MKHSRLLMALPLLTLVGCATPHVVPASQDAAFRLSNLRSQQIAVFPVATADLDESVSKTVADEYKSKSAFLDTFSSKLSNRLIGVCKEPSLTSNKVATLLLAADGTRPLLDPARLLGGQDPNNRFAGAPSQEAIGTVAQLPDFKDIRYAIVARDLGVGRQWSTHTNAGGGFVSTGPGGGTFVGASSSSSAKTSARLRLAILDLQTRGIVWDGAVYADTSSTFMKVTALHEIEDDLAIHLVNEVLGIK